MTNRETMPGTTGKIPKNANNKNESSRARSPSPVCVPHWWWLGRDGVERRASVVGIGVVVDAGVGLRDALVAGVGVTVVVIVGE